MIHEYLRLFEIESLLSLCSNVCLCWLLKGRVGEVYKSPVA